MQEVEINHGYNQDLLSFNGYYLLCETNYVKARRGIYMKNGE